MARYYDSGGWSCPNREHARGVLIRLQYPKNEDAERAARFEVFLVEEDSRKTLGQYSPNQMEWAWQTLVETYGEANMEVRAIVGGT